MKTCKQPGCGGTTRGFGWCAECKARHARGELMRAPAPKRPRSRRVVVEMRPQRPEPRHPVVEQRTQQTEHGYRCPSCTLHFPLLVDGLCMRCDALHYPSTPATRPHYRERQARAS